MPKNELPTLIEFDRNADVPFFKQIYNGYREAILSGRLRPGQRLPSTRGLAKELGISRLPAINAFEQLLHEGYIEGKIGAGSYVKDSIPDDLSRPVASHDNADRGSTKQKIRSNLPPNERILGPFRVSLPALDHFPNAIWSKLVSRHARNLSFKNMSYGDPAGHLPLREAIAAYLRSARAVRCEAGQILITSGSQNGASTVRGGSVGQRRLRLHRRTRISRSQECAEEHRRGSRSGLSRQ